MNELGAIFDSHPEWATGVDETGRLLAEAIVRLAAREDPSLLPLTGADEDAVRLLLVLAAAVGHEHAALDLRAGVLEGLAEDLGLAEPSEAAAASRRAALDGGPLASALIERVGLADPVEPRGRPVLVGLADGAPVLCHLRRYGHAEWRLAEALLEAGGALDDGTVAGRAAARRISLVTGGPGTGKTTAVAGALGELANRLGARPRVALCAPTAKAARRLRAALESAWPDGAARPFDLDDGSGSVHHLLGRRIDRAHDRSPLPCDVVVVDEASMLDLDLFDEIVARLAPGARVVLAGDADQLASVNVGAVLRDVVTAAEGTLPHLVTRLTENHRFDPVIARAAAAVGAGDLAGLVDVAASSGGRVRLFAEPEAVRQSAASRAAELGRLSQNGDPDAALAHLQGSVVLCATREGPGSVADWNERLARELARPEGRGGGLAVGTPVLVTRNESTAGPDGVRLSNGDVGVVVAHGDGRRAVFALPEGRAERGLGSLSRAEAAFALTIHKSQGSEYDEVVVSLPGADSPILTRELVYTALTRARSSVTVLGSEEVLARALSRRVSRVSGLADRVAALAAASQR